MEDRAEARYAVTVSLDGHMYEALQNFKALRAIENDAEAAQVLLSMLLIGICDKPRGA